MYCASIAIGCVVSLLVLGVSVTGIGLWFPPFWPGLWFSWLIVILCRGESWPRLVGSILVTLGNATFYSWLSYRVVKAEALSRGRLGRILLR